MGHYDFKKDLNVSNKTEYNIVALLKRLYPDCIKSIHINCDYRYDLLIVTNNDKKIRIEVKEDFMCKKTGNVAVEFMCRGRISGISKTEADLYLYKIHEPDGTIGIYTINVKWLRDIIALGKYDRMVVGGDEGSCTKNYLFALNKFLILTKAEFQYRIKASS